MGRIIHEEGDYFVQQASNTAKGFEVFRNVGCYAVRVASIGYTGDEGLTKAKAEVVRRIEKDKQAWRDAIPRIMADDAA